jgi:hypothetical protein
MRQLIPRTALLQALYQRPEERGCGVVDHRRLIDQMAKGDEDRAVETLRHHLLGNRSRLSMTSTSTPSVDLAVVFAGNKPDARHKSVKAARTRPPAATHPRGDSTGVATAHKERRRRIGRQKRASTPPALP